MDGERRGGVKEKNEVVTADHVVKCSDREALEISCQLRCHKIERESPNFSDKLVVDPRQLEPNQIVSLCSSRTVMLVLHFLERFHTC